MVKRRAARWLAAVLLGWGAAAAAAEFGAEVDRRALALNEAVTLKLTLSDSETRLRAEGINPNVDLSVLAADFDVGVPRVDHRYNVYQGRGRSTSELAVELFPRRGGTLTIPAFRLDGLATRPITLTVRALPSGAMPEVYSRGGVSTRTPWQREQFTAWLDVYHRIELKTASVGEYIDSEPLRIELMEHRELPQSRRRETVDGTPYDVIRIAWAIYPKDAGALHLHLPDVWLVAADGRRLRLPHQRATVEVRALPANVTEDIPVGTPQLQQTTPTPAPGVNQLSTWTVTVRGTFSRFALPELLPLAAPAGIKLYADRAARDTEVHDDGVTTRVDYTLSAMPERAGRYALPAVRVPYFDTARGELAVAELAGPALEASGAAAAPPPAATRADHARTESATTGTAAGGADDARLWQGLSAGLALLWLATLVLWWRARRPPAAAPAPAAPAPAPARHPLQARLLAALGGRSLDLGLAAWEARHGIDQEVRAAVRAVQDRLYGPRKTSDDAALHALVEQAAEKIRRAAAQRRDAEGADPWRPESFSRAVPPA